MKNQNLFNLVEPILPLKKMEQIERQSSHSYITAEPFPHIVIDDFFEESFLNKILDEFPSNKDIDWKRFDTFYEKKLASQHELQIGELTRYLIYQLHSSHFVNFLEKLTNIPGLIPDPHLIGGGLHQILPGGKLAIHADFNQNPKLKLDRRLNLLIFLNKDWQENYGGHFELWDKGMNNCVKKVLPLFNRVVIFSTSDYSFHGHPDPLKCPPDRSRKSIALYYYSNGRPEEEVGDEHNTLFKVRPGEVEIKEEKEPTWVKFVPPIIWEMRDRIRNGR